MTLHVTVCIVGYRNPGDIVTCLAALQELTHSDFEVVICENGGADAFADLASHVPQKLKNGQAVSLIEAPGNLGFASGVNRCFAHASATDAWWILNPDTEPFRDTLALMVERLAPGDCQAVGCTLYRPDGLVQSYGGRWRPWLARAESIGVGASLDDPRHQAAVEAAQNYVSGASMLVGRRFLQTVGPMREDYFLYVEEVEWCLRAAALGMRLGFAPEALVLHQHGTTTGVGAEIRGQPRLPIYLDQRNRILLTRDRFPARLPVAAGAALALIVLRYGRRLAWRQLGYAMEGWWAGLMDRRGPPINSEG